MIRVSHKVNFLPLNSAEHQLNDLQKYPLGKVATLAHAEPLITENNSSTKVSTHQKKHLKSHSVTKKMVLRAGQDE